MVLAGEEAWAATRRPRALAIRLGAPFLMMAGLRSSDERRTLTRRIGNVQGTPWRGSRHQNQRSWPFVPLRRVLHCVRRVAALPTFEPLHNQSSAARGRPSAPEGPLAYSLHEPAQSPAFSVAPSGSFRRVSNPGSPPSCSGFGYCYRSPHRKKPITTAGWRCIHPSCPRSPIHLSPLKTSKRR